MMLVSQPRGLASFEGRTHLRCAGPVVMERYAADPKPKTESASNQLHERRTRLASRSAWVTSASGMMIEMRVVGIV